MSLTGLQPDQQALALPFSAKAFPRVANAAARMLGLPIIFKLSRFKPAVSGDVIGERGEMTFGHSATAYVFGPSRVAPALSVELACAPTPDTATIGMQGWRAVIETINTEVTAQERATAFDKMAAGIKPGGAFELPLGGFVYRLSWIQNTVIRLVAVPQTNG